MNNYRLRKIIITIIMLPVILGAFSACSSPSLISGIGDETTGSDPMVPAEITPQTNQLKKENWKINGPYKYYEEEGYTSKIGIDISEWTEEIDWEELKNTMVEFVIIRVGYRGYETGKLVIDNKFEEHIKAATDAGLGIGLYFFSQAVNEQEAKEEAEFVLENIGGCKIDYPIYYDIEGLENEATRVDDLTPAHYTAHASAFCSIIEAAGYQAGIYGNQKWLTNLLDPMQLQNYDIWLAKYDKYPSYQYHFDMWQYTESGEIGGINGLVDLNVRVEKN